MEAIGNGIFVEAGFDANVYQYGNIISHDASGINAVSHSGNVEVLLQGDITAAYDGIHAVSYTGDVYVHTPGTIQGGHKGIFADAGGNAVINQTGDVTGTAAQGIDVRALGNATVESHGNVSGGYQGIRVHAFGDITILQYGDVTSHGTAGSVHGDAIYSYSDTGGDIEITTGNGTIFGPNTGVRFVGIGNNILTNHASILGGVNAILGDDTGNDTIENFGSVTGNVDLGGGSNAFNNYQAGLFNSGMTVDLGGGNLLNAGTLSPGGSGTVLTTTLTGDLTQTGSGQFVVDLQGANADLINVDGAASLAGTVKPNFTLSGLGSTTQWTILTTTGSAIDNQGISAVSTPVVQFDLLFPPSTTEMDLVLLGVDFVVGGLNRNETAIAQNANKIFAAGVGPALDPMLTALAQLPTTGAVANALDQLSPEIYLDTEIATLFSQLAFTNTMMTCPTRDGRRCLHQGRRVRLGAGQWPRLRSGCRPSRPLASTRPRSRSQRARNLRLGRCGGSAAPSATSTPISRLTPTPRRKATGSVAALVVKYNPGALLLAAGVSGGTRRLRHRPADRLPRLLALVPRATTTSAPSMAASAPPISSTNGAWYAKPMVDLDATMVNLDNVKESGAGGVGLNVSRQQ